VCVFEDGVSVAKRDSFALLFIVYCFFLRQKSQSLAASLCLRFRAPTPGQLSGLPAPLQIEQLCRRLHCLRPLLVLLIVLLQCVRCNNLLILNPPSESLALAVAAARSAPASSPLRLEESPGLTIIPLGFPVDGS
jgi:hypothetical protein